MQNAFHKERSRKLLGTREWHVLDHGFDAEAREIEEWTNQAPKPKDMEWKWKESKSVHDFKNILFAEPGISSKISMHLKSSAEMVGVFTSTSDDIEVIDWKDDRIAFGMALYKCDGYFLIVCSERLDPIYYFQCANAVLSLVTANSKIALLKIDKAPPSKQSELHVVSVGKETVVPEDSIMITGLSASIIVACQIKSLNASCFQITQAPLGFTVLKSGLDQIFALFQLSQSSLALTIDANVKKIQASLRTTADYMFL